MKMALVPFGDISESPRLQCSEISGELVKGSGPCIYCAMMAFASDIRGDHLLVPHVVVYCLRPALNIYIPLRDVLSSKSYFGVIYSVSAQGGLSLSVHYIIF